MTCLDTCPALLVRHTLNHLHDTYDFTWADIAGEVGMSIGQVCHAAQGRTKDYPAWVGHRVLDFADAVAADPPRRYPVGPLLQLVDASSTPRQRLLDAADRRLLLHAVDRGWLSVWDADRLSVALGHTPHTIWGEVAA